MKPVTFLAWLRDEVGVIRHSKEGDKRHPPSNGEFRRWIKNGALRVNGKTINLEDIVEWPIIELVLFPNNPTARCSIV